MRSTLIAIALIIIILPVTSPAEELDVSGSWDITFETPRGTQTREMSIKQDGSELEVSTVTMRGDVITGKGKIEGDTITWTQEMNGPGRGSGMVVTYTGIVTGNNIKGSMDRGGREIEWTASRKTTE